jgi:4-amino-4-deoxy-L-arabinose transferase-like glycosyltransferase
MTSNGVAASATVSRSEAAPVGAGAIAAILAAFVVVWTAYFTISQAATSLHHDMVEAYVWGQEYQLGYIKHPPFWSWVCGAWFAVFPRADWAFAMLSSVNAALGLLGSWMLIGCFADGDKRVAAAALLLLTPFYTFLSYRYNANTIFLSIWPWTLFFFVRAIDRGKLFDAILFGVFMALAVLSKYYAVVLAATCLLAALQHPARRRYFLSASPYVSTAVGLLVCVPHFYWLLTNDAPTVRYFADEMRRSPSYIAVHIVVALFGALAWNALAFAAVAYVGRSGLRSAPAALRSRAADPRFRLLATLVATPLILTVIAPIFLRNKVSPHMLIGVFSLMPLLAIEIAGVVDFARLRKLAIWAAGLLSVGPLLASPVVALGIAWFSNEPDVIEPRKELAAAATELWRAKTGRPLQIVGGGDDAYPNAVAFYGADRPHGFDRLEVVRSPWVTPSALAKGGLLIVCVKSDAVCRARTRNFVTPQASETELTLTHDLWVRVADPVTFVATVIPPTSD